ncbi:hypothetical protein GHT06_015707 [Daphnia sinensis]|uniref:Translation initiation factor eIF2B subunit epsilon n=1 Tax=Daphnia sinensis TaxID=1820382 RepID=A0AAD5LJL7_9CRUS|nr:hypothetical protein GHT06_015707 [Daphnia sinensis]
MSKAVKSGTAKPGSEVVKQEDVIVAILIADSFSIRFAPVTDLKPKALLPLVNRPMIDYALESLLLSGVQKTFVYCVAHADQIRLYLRESKWMRAASPMSIEVISQSSDDCRSLGDSLRDIDGKSLIRGDFILMSADVISNVQLIPILEEHREKRKTDKGIVMTHIFKKSFLGHRSRSAEEELVLAVNPTNGRILNYQQSKNLKKLNFPLEMFKEHGLVDLRYDLVDTHISICSPVVLPLFSDNFDYQTWGDFVRGILINEEILNNTIYYHQLEGSYAAHVSNISMYDAVSKDIIQRWTYPLVPDLNRSDNTPRHTLSRHNVYKQPGVTLGKESVLEMDVVVGENSEIGEHTYVTQSVIGKRCKIGNNVRISNAYIWDDVIIEDECCVEVALIADGVVLKKGVELGHGCVLGPGVKLAPSTKIAANTRLMASPPKSENDFETSDEEEENVPVPVSADSIGYVYHRPVEEDSDAESLVDELWGLEIEDETDSEEGDEDELDNDEDEDHEEDLEVGDLPEDMNARSFYNEVLESLQRGYEEKIKGDNLVLEINSSKYAYNVTMKEVNMLVIKAMLSLPSVMTKKGGSGTNDDWAALRPILQHFLPVLRNYLKNNQSMLDSLEALEEFGVNNPQFAKITCKVLHYLYGEDVLHEDAILEWHANPPNDPSAMKTIRKIVEPFITWLEEAEEESSDESD